MVSDAVKLAFPESLRKRSGDSKLSYCYGIIKRDEPQPTVCGPTTTVSTSEVSATHTDRETQLLERVKALEERERQLVEMVKALENVVQSQTPFSPDHLVAELDTLTRPHNSAHHGPDTIEHLQKFSIETLTAEFTQHTPHLYELLKSLDRGDTNPKPLIHL